MGDIIPPDTYYHLIVVESDLRDGCATQIYTPPCTLNRILLLLAASQLQYKHYALKKDRKWDIYHNTLPAYSELELTQR